MKVRILMSLVALLVAAQVGFSSASPAKAASANVSKAGLSAATLADLGIKREFLSLVYVSDDGKTVVGWEKESDAKRIAKGEVIRLHIFGAVDGKWTDKAVWLPCTAVHQFAVSEDGRWALAVAESGMRLVAVDLASGAAHVVSSFKSGESGFRVRPYMVWPEGGKFAALGYFQDADGTTRDDSVVAIDPAGTSQAAIVPIRNVAVLLKATRGARVAGWHSSSQAVFGGAHPDKTVHLYAWLGKDLADLDKADDFRLMPGKDRVLYVARRNGTHEAVVCDLLTLQKQPVKAPAGKVLSYPLMSFDGSTVVLSTIDFQRGRMSTWYAHPSDSWTLHPLAGMQDVSSGALRLSPGGQALALLNNDGVQVFALPAP